MSAPELTPGVTTLVGMFDSPYVRRVAVSMEQLEVPFESRPWSVGRDQDKLRTLNPLGRVPVLVLASGEVLIESSIMLDYLDEQAGPERRLLPAAGAPRRLVQDWLALITGTLDKGIQIAYDRIFKPADKQHGPWIERCYAQTNGGLRELDRRCAERADAAWLCGDAISQADVSLACFITYLRDSVQVDLDAVPKLRERVARLESLPLFAKYYLPFDPPQPTASAGASA
jgi:glutathione S-transferase